MTQFKSNTEQLLQTNRDRTKDVIEHEPNSGDILFKCLFESMQEGFAFHEVICNDQGEVIDYRYLEINPAFERLTGLQRETTVGRTVRELIPGIEEHWIKTFGRVAITGEPAELENYVQELDRYYRIKAYSPERGKFAVVFEEVTEQKRLIRSLEEREAELRVLFESSQAGIILVDPSGRITRANLRMAEMFGCNLDEMVGSSYPSHVHPDHRGAGDERMRQLITGEIDHVGLERHYIRKDGSDFWGYLSGRRHTDGNGRLISLVGHITDITELKKAVAEIQQRELLYNSLVETASDLIWRCDSNGRYTFLNKSWESAFGYRIDDMLGRPFSDFMTPAQAERDLGEFNRLITSCGEVRNLESVHLRKDGTPIILIFNATAFRDGNGEVIGTQGTAHDITERKRAEELRRETQELFALFMQHTPVYTFIKEIDNGQSRVIQISDNFIDMIGKPAKEMLGHTMYEMFPVDFARKITEDDLAIVREGEVQQLEEELDGLFYSTIKFPILRQGKKPLLAGFTIDISERKKAEEERLALERQLLHTQKLESLGVLAGGIAHDFNNILTAIIGNAELALMRLNPESPVQENLQRIEKAAARAADLARQMLAYSGKGKFVVESIDLNKLVEEMRHMLEVSISKKVILRDNFYKPLPTVNVDATQIRQIVMNLVINASEAIGDRSGVIAITTGCLDCTRDYLKDVWLDENLTEGLYVFLEIADTGCGMDRETLAKIFDPFFTTKFTGRGLGMAAVLGIIRGHKGSIKVYSEPGKGSSFKVLLPAGERPAELFNGETSTDDWRGSGVALLVDDEETVRAIGSEMLRELGLTVITAADGREAVDKFKANPDIQVVILDLTMPHMDGEQCFRELRMLDPNVRVIMSSGFSEHEVTQKFSGKGLAGFIQKPYKLSTLKAVIRKVGSQSP